MNTDPCSLKNRINARNRSVIWAIDAESLDAMDRATFSYTGPDYQTVLQSTSPTGDGAMYSIADCVEALRSNEWRSLVRTTDDPPIARSEFVALYHGPTRSGSMETFVCTRDELSYWDPFATDDGWPGYDAGMDYVSPHIEAHMVSRFLTLPHPPAPGHCANVR